MCIYTSQKSGFIVEPHSQYHSQCLFFPPHVSKESWKQEWSSSSAHELTLFPYFDALLCRLPLTLRCQREIHHAACRKKTWHCRLRHPLRRDEIQSCSHPPLPSFLFLYHFLLPSSFHVAPNFLSRNFHLFPRHHSFTPLSPGVVKDPQPPSGASSYFALKPPILNLCLPTFLVTFPGQHPK